MLITAQLAANVLGPRTIIVGPFLLPGGIWSFPLTFFLWDIVTEVYGFKRARQLILYYLIGQMFFAFLIHFALNLKAAPSIQHPEYYTEILGRLFRLTVSMMIAIVLGDFVNCFVLDKLKELTHDKYLWMRLIGATALGELVTSLVWVFSFYAGVSGHPPLFNLIFSQYIIKIIFEIVFIPPTYLIVYFLKKNEMTDTNRRYIDFDPYTLEKFSKTKSTEI